MESLNICKSLLNLKMKKISKMQFLNLIQKNVFYIKKLIKLFDQTIMMPFTNIDITFVIKFINTDPLNNTEGLHCLESKL